MAINLRVPDKYEINHTCDRQMERQTIPEVHTGKIYKFVRSDVVTRGVTERRILMTPVSKNVRN